VLNLDWSKVAGSAKREEVEPAEEFTGWQTAPDPKLRGSIWHEV
jgi:hypothetical protein